MFTNGTKMYKPASSTQANVNQRKVVERIFYGSSGN